MLAKCRFAPFQWRWGHQLSLAWVPSAGQLRGNRADVPMSLWMWRWDKGGIRTEPENLSCFSINMLDPDEMETWMKWVFCNYL